MLGMLSLSFLPGQSTFDNGKVLELGKSVQAIEALAQFNNSYQNNEQKIVNIMNWYNKKMPAAKKQAIADEILEMTLRYSNLDVDLICATITHESARSWNPKVVSKAGAMGLMQIMPRTGKWLAKSEGVEWTSTEAVLFDPIHNIRLGTGYLSKLINKYDLEGGLAAYNGGWKRAKKWLANDKADGILWAETRSYIPHVLKLYDKYRGTAH
jgi:soluble lytic murein transglycosylase